MKRYVVQYKYKDHNNAPMTTGVQANSEAEAKAKFEATHPSSKYVIMNIYEG